MPDNLYGQAMCGRWLTHAPHTLWTILHTHLVPLLAVALLALAAGVGRAVWRHHVWRHAATSAVWLQVTPPVTATPAATLALWQLLATLLPAPRRWSLYAHRLVWEVHATPDGMRCGLWVPPGINPTAVLRALNRAWPGVRATQTQPPTLAARQPTIGLQLDVAAPDWAPLVDNPDPVPTARLNSTPEADQIRAVYDGLAAAGRTSTGLLQVHIGRAPRHRVTVLRRAAIDPRRARHRPVAVRLLLLAILAIRTVPAGVMDLFISGPSSNRAMPATADPVLAEQARQARTRYAAGPHLLVAIRAYAAGPTHPAARAAAADITSGYSLLAAHWRPHRIRHPVKNAARRWVPERRMRLATVAETAALAGLPAEPSAYGLPSAPSRRLAPTHDTFTTPAPVSPRRASVMSGGAQPQQDPPTVWSTP